MRTWTEPQNSHVQEGDLR